MKILSWNIQSGLGCDGVRDLNRIADYIKDAGSPEIVCLQEVSRNIAEYSTVGQEDQLSILQSLLPDYVAYWGSGQQWIREDGVVEEFGNVTFAQVPVVQSKSHLLPQPPVGDVYQMSRVAIEIVVPHDGGFLRIMNTHLAFHATRERCLQLEYFDQYQTWCAGSVKEQVKQGPGAYAHNRATASTIICGDCNLTPSSAEYTSFTQNGWRDCWVALYQEESHAPTCGIFDTISWPEGPHCRDYFWMSEDCAWQPRAVRVDQSTNYSDHQPIFLILE